MQLFKKGQAESAATNDAGSASKGSNGTWFSNNKRSIAAVALIVIAALFMRTVFSWAISAGSEYALSGGTIASEHLRNVTAMISSGSFFGIDTWMYAPDGSINVHPPLVDMIVAGIGSIIKAITGWTAAESAAAALGWSSAIMGALACIPAYYLGKEVFNGRKGAGFLTALFLAFCPVVISNTVFSNGTEIAFILFFAICMFYFIAKGVKFIDTTHTLNSDFKTMFEANKTAMKYALFAGIMLIIIAYSWNGFRSLVMLMIFVMACIMIVNRLKVVDARPVVMFFSTIIILGVGVSAPYYCICGLWDLVFSGLAYATIIGLVACISFALLQKKPWVYTIPAYIIALVVLFVVLYFAVPEVFNVIVYGNSVYAQDIQSIIGSQNLSLSQVATYFGYLTMWCGAIVLIYMLFKFLKNSDNVPFLVSFFALFIGMILAVNSTALAVIYSPFFALGFAAFIIWIFDTVNFSEYFKSFRGCTFKTFWRKLISPKPFIAIICVIILIAAPNMMTAIDASISNNEKEEWNQGAEDLLHDTFVGAMGYSVLTDEDYKINYTLKQYGANSKDNGTVLTWIDYSADVVTYGHFKSVTDTRGNNGVAMAQILLGDEVRGESTAAMVVYSMEHMGLKAGAVYLAEKGYFGNLPVINTAVKDRIIDLANNTEAYKNYLLRNPSVYGQLLSNLSDENVTYLFLKKYLTVGAGAGVDIVKANDNSKTGYHDDGEFYGCSSWALSKAYSDISSKTNTKIDSVMVSLSMIPIRIGDGSLFQSIATIAGYASTTATVGNGVYAQVPYFYTINTSSGAYTYTNEMYNSLVYKAIGGKTSEEAAQSYDSSVFESVYGLSNFNADYSKFYVKYNSDSAATSESNGWKTMTYDEANQLKTEKGGVINYYGYPIVVDVVDYLANDSRAVKGTIDMYSSEKATDTVENARVELWNGDCTHKLATAYTDKFGYYEVPIIAEQKVCTLKVYAGAASTATTGGALVFSKVVNYDDTIGTVDYTIQHTMFNGYVDFQDKDITNKFATAPGDSKFKVVITGTNFKNVYETTGTWDDTFHRVDFSFNDKYLVIDTYSIAVKTEDGTSIGTGSYTLSQGSNDQFVITGTICEEVVTVVDENEVPISGVKVELKNETSKVNYNLGETDILGETDAMYIIPGTYTVTVKNGDKIVTSGTISVSSATSTNTVKVYANSKTIEINGNGYAGDTIYVTNGSYSELAYKDAATGKYKVHLPVSSLNDAAAAVYTAYAFDGSNVYWQEFKASATSDTNVNMEKSDDYVLVTGKLTKKVDNNSTAVSGTVYFKSGNRIISTNAIKYEGSTDYVYKLYLPNGKDWEITATDSTSYIFTETTGLSHGEGTKTLEKNIEMTTKAYSVSGKFVWGSSVPFEYVAMSCDGDGRKFTVTTDSTGSFSFMIPEGKSCTVTTPNLDGTAYFFSDNSQGTQSFTFNTDNKSHTFTAYADNKKVKYDNVECNYVVENKTGYEIYIGGTTVAKDGVYKCTSSSLLKPYLSYELKYVLIDGSYYYASMKCAVEPKVAADGTITYTIGPLTAEQIKNHCERYQLVDVTYKGDKVPVVTITNMRSSDLVNEGTETDKNITKPFADLTIKDGTNDTTSEVRHIKKYISYNECDKVTYYEKLDTQTIDPSLRNPYQVKITRTVDVEGGTESRIYYTTLLGKDPVTIDADAVVTAKSVTLSGTTGSSYSGNLTLDLGAVNSYIPVSISSGSYSISLPAGATYANVKAIVTNTVNETTLRYVSMPTTITVPTDKTSFTQNIPVEMYTESTNDESVTIDILNMTNDDTIHESTLTFFATLKGAENGKTYLLSGGSAWSSLKFYVYDPYICEYVEATSATGITGPGELKVMCVGTIGLNYEKDGKTTTSATAAADSSNLTVIFSEANGTVVARGGFYNYTTQKAIDGWKQTNLPVEIGNGSNAYGQGSTTFSIKVVNPNNVAAIFDLKLLNIGEEEGVYYQMVCGKEIYIIDNDTQEHILLPGASTTEIQIKKVYVNGTASTTTKLDVQLTETDTTFALKQVENAKGVSISGNVATVKCDISTDGQIDVKDHDASGRGVFNTLGTTPVYVMVLSALVLIGVIAMLWLGFRRGVFSRKK